MKKAFTLAEVLVTLTVIGIITAVILPVAIHSKPNQNVMKFKKAHNMLYQAISTLVNSEKYHSNGDLGLRVDGGLIEDATYFCKSFSDIVSTKSTNCTRFKPPTNNTYSDWHINLGWEFTESQKHQIVDDICSAYLTGGEEIVLSDDTIIYETNSIAHFGAFYCNSTIYENKESANSNSCPRRAFSGTNTHANNTSEFDTVYKTVCIDIDGLNKGESAFGYGIRSDGKIFVGKKALEWLDKSIQEEN